MHQLIPGDSLDCVPVPVPERSKQVDLTEALRKDIDRAHAVSERVYKRHFVDWKQPELPVWVCCRDVCKSGVSKSQRRNTISYNFQQNFIPSEVVT